MLTTSPRARNVAHIVNLEYELVNTHKHSNKKQHIASNMSRGDNQLPRVCFDDEYRVRVLEKENIEHTQELEQESNQFATSASLTLF